MRGFLQKKLYSLYDFNETSERFKLADEKIKRKRNKVIIDTK